jgi:hypothetical protein
MGRWVGEVLASIAAREFHNLRQVTDSRLARYRLQNVVAHQTGKYTAKDGVGGTTANPIKMEFLGKAVP